MIRVSGTPGLPWIDPCVFANRSTCETTGHDINYFESIARHMGIGSIEYISVERNGSPLDNCSVNTVYSSLKCGVADISISLQFMESHLTPLYVDYSFPVKQNGAAVHVPKVPLPHDLHQLASIYRIWDEYTWILVILTATAYGLLVNKNRKLQYGLQLCSFFLLVRTTSAVVEIFVKTLVLVPAFTSVEQALTGVRRGQARVALRAKTYEWEKFNKKTIMAKFGNAAAAQGNLLLERNSYEAFAKTVESAKCTGEKLTVSLGNTRHWVWAKSEIKEAVEPLYYPGGFMYILFPRKSALKLRFNEVLKELDGFRGVGNYITMCDHKYRGKSPARSGGDQLLPYKKVELTDMDLVFRLMLILLLIPISVFISELIYQSTLHRTSNLFTRLYSFIIHQQTIVLISYC